MGFFDQTPDSTFITAPLVLKGTLLLQIITVLSPEILYVAHDGTCGGNSPCYGVIQYAVNGAASGDTIRLAQGPTTEVLC